MKKVFLLFSLMLLTGVMVNAQTVNLTLKVDMGIEIAKGNFVPGTDVVRAAGAFQGWDPGAAPDMVDDDNDSVYVITIPVTPNTSYEYKYLIGTGWGKDEFQGKPNRSVTVADADMTLDPVFFNYVGSYTGVESPVTFEVDLRLPAKGAFNPATDKAYVAGSFTDWGNGAVEMTDANSDSIYDVTVNLVSGTVLAYKFIYSKNTAGNGTWETLTTGEIFGNDKNRIAPVVDGNNLLSFYWENKDPNVTVADGNILFQVDMSVAVEMGAFNPDADSVQIRGSFNGWNDSQPDKSLMNQDALNPNLWYLNVALEGLGVGDTLAYKYFIKNPAEAEQFANTGWEVNIGRTITSDRNRPVIFEGIANQEQPVQYFDNIRPEYVIPAGTTVTSEFSVDMTPATTQANAFVPGTDTVYWVPREPLFFALNDLNWSDPVRILRLTDEDGDMIYKGTLTLEGPAYNGFLYYYAYTNVTQGFVYEDINQQESRVRFIGQTGGANVFDSPWTMPQDTWTNDEVEEEYSPIGLTGVKQVNGIVKSYSLEQNYPNPFNPSTMINFSIQDAGMVTLKVYNLLGEEVATLVNGELATGSYKVDFNAANLSTGIYFYSIRANNFTATKKMMLIK
jgi:hypothetical protein